MSDDEFEDVPGADAGGTVDLPASPPGNISSDLPDGVVKDIVKKGEGWKRPKKGDKVEVVHTGMLKDGTEIASSREGPQPCTFILGKHEVKGLNLSLDTMLKGEKAKLTFPPEYAYGETGLPPKVPGNSTVIFEVELVSWVATEDLFGDDGAIKSLLGEGTSSWNKPKEGSEVLMSIKATAEGGTVLEEKPNTDYTIGSGVLGPLSKVVDKTLMGMSKGERCSVACAKGYVHEEGSNQSAVSIDLCLHELYTLADVSLLKDKSVMKKAVKEGDGYEKPQDGAKVTLKVESATNGEDQLPLPGFLGPRELEFESCNGDVCDALEGAVREMRKKERAVLTCTVPAKVCESKLGLDKVEAAKVVMIIELVDFVKGKDIWTLRDEEKVELAIHRKDMGAKLFGAKRYELALEKYRKVEQAAPSHDNFEKSLRQKAAEVKRAAELNKAACFLKVGDWKGAVTSCDKVLKEDTGNVKALFRRAKAKHERADYADAQADLALLLQLDPTNAEAKKQLQTTQRAQKLMDKKAKATYAKMCQGLGKLETVDGWKDSWD